MISGLISHIGTKAASQIIKLLILLAYFFQSTVTLTEEIHETDLQNLSLEELMKIKIVTSASKRQENITAAPSVVSVMTAEEIALFGGRNFSEIISRMLGVQTHNTLVTGRNFIGIRSDQPAMADNSHVLILLNGSAWAQDSYNGGLFNNANSSSLPIESIERIELIRGPGSVLYGTKAFQGVINIVTKSADKNSLTVSAGKGQRDTNLYRADATYKQGDMSVTLNTMSMDTDGPVFSWSAGSQNGQLTTNMPEDNVGILLTAHYKKLKATAWYGDSNQSSMRIDYSDAQSPQTVRGFWDNKKYFANLSYNTDLSDNWQLGSKLAINSHRSEISLWGDTIGPNVQYESDDQSLEMNLIGSGGTGTNYLLGTLITRRTGATPGMVQTVPDWTQIWSNLYAQVDHYVTDAIKVTLGGQYNDAESNTKFVPRLGAIIQFTPQYGMKLLYGEAFRSPENVERDVYIPGINLFGNPEVGPELIKTTDLQFFYDSKQAYAAIAFFRSEQKDLITRYFREDGNISFHNEDSVIIKGVEIEAKTTFFDRWFVTSGISYQNNKGTGGVKNFTLQPKVEGRLGIGYSAESYSFGIYDSYKSQYQKLTLRNPSYVDVNPASQAWHNISLNVLVNLGDVFDITSLKKSTLGFYFQNLLNETIFLPTLNSGGNASTLPAEAGRAIFIEFHHEF